MIETANLDRWNSRIRRALGTMARERIMERILRGDGTVWKAADREISNRLGWLDPVPTASGSLPGIEAFARAIRKAGCERALLLGMGGSSLAPEVYARAAGRTRGAIPLRVLDTTSPDAVARAARRLDPARTLFIISSKSGTTAETNALLNFFYGLASDRLGTGRAGNRFAAITDPGTPLEGLARKLGFRRVFSGNPDVGGRFSALTVFGLLPAVVAGFDARTALSASEPQIQACRTADPEKNPAAVLGTILGLLARDGIDKAVFPVFSGNGGFADWVEQLVAESTGKEGRGILPVPVRDFRAPSGIGRDCVYIMDAGTPDNLLRMTSDRLKKAGAPVISVHSGDGSSLPGRFYLWEMAVAVACHHLGINPFDQPDVEATKRKTREALSTLDAGGPEPALAGGANPGTAARLTAFLAGARTGGYVALQAFLDPSPAARKALDVLAVAIRDKTGLPVTTGFGPRYLHSTGQLHKGDSGRGAFVQITGGSGKDVAIPEIGGKRPAPTFGTLIRAQALGDRLALGEAGRRVMRIDLGRRVLPGLRELARS